MIDLQQKRYIYACGIFGLEAKPCHGLAVMTDRTLHIHAIQEHDRFVRDSGEVLDLRSPMIFDDLSIIANVKTVNPDMLWRAEHLSASIRLAAELRATDRLEMGMQFSGNPFSAVHMDDHLTEGGERYVLDPGGMNGKTLLFFMLVRAFAVQRDHIFNAHAIGYL